MANEMATRTADRAAEHVTDHGPRDTEHPEKSYLTPQAIRRAEDEPTLYQALYDSLDDEHRAVVDRLSPFARELQLWIWHRPGPELSHSKLAQMLGIPVSTVNAWFSVKRRTRPEGVAFQQVLKTTGWPIEHLLALTGYDTPPPYKPDVWDWLDEQVEQWKHFDATMWPNVRAFLRDARERYNARPQRPPSPPRGTKKGTR